MWEPARGQGQKVVTQVQLCRSLNQDCQPKLKWESWAGCGGKALAEGGQSISVLSGPWQHLQNAITYSGVNNNFPEETKIPSTFEFITASDQPLKAPDLWGSLLCSAPLYLQSASRPYVLSQLLQ